MTRVIMHGCNGHMGRVISELAAKDSDVEIVAGIVLLPKDTVNFKRKVQLRVRSSNRTYRESAEVQCTVITWRSL